MTISHGRRAQAEEGLTRKMVSRKAAKVRKVAKGFLAKSQRRDARKGAEAQRDFSQRRNDSQRRNEEMHAKAQRREGISRNDAMKRCTQRRRGAKGFLATTP